MRGTPANRIELRHLIGIIPAYAGNTYDMGYGDFETWDHPRVCGEHGSVDKVLDGTEGSSPRMRGTLQLDVQLCGVGGIIPAYAGNT